MKKTKIPEATGTIEKVDKLIDSFQSNYQSNGKVKRINIRELCSDWAWAKRSDVYTHYFHRYPAKLLPYIPIFFLSSSLPLNGPALDPFGGTGTVAVEAVTHFVNPKDCNLIEINPLARLISSAKITPISPNVLKQKYKELKKIIAQTKTTSSMIPEFPGIDFWFRKQAIVDLSAIKFSINKLSCSVEIKDFFLVCFSAIIRDMSKADPMVSPPVILTAGKFSKEQKEQVEKIIKKKNQYKAKVLFENNVTKNILRMEEFWNVWEITQKKASVIGYDARKMTNSQYLGNGKLSDKEKKLRENSVGIVITSPPYINAQKYTRTTKLELWWLDLIGNDLVSMANYDRTLIGTEGVNFNDYKEVKAVNNTYADNFIDQVYLKDKKKAGIISKYFNDMRMTLREIKRTLKPGGYCVLVVGNNFVFKEQIKNHKILSEISNDEGLETRAILVDEIRSRGLFTKRNDTAGVIADEWIILLQKPALS